MKKNKFVEEWNGRREITEKAFNVDGKNAMRIVFYAVAVPYFFYSWTRKEFVMKGDRRYKDMA